MPKNLKDRQKSANKKVLVIGDSGSGKTKILRTFPKPIYIADFDNGLDVLAGEEIEFEEYFDSPEKPDSWMKFMADLKKWHKEGPPGKTVALDSLTSAAEAALRNQLRVTGHSTANIQQGDWGKAISDVKDALAYLLTLPCTVVVTAHYRMIQDDTNVMHYAPLVYGKDLPHKVPTYFNDIWRTFIDMKPGNPPTVDYRMQVLPSPKYNTLKNTLDLKDMFVAPNFQTLLGGA